MALGLALSFIKIYKLPFGGSASLGILPLLLIAARQGYKIGIACGFGFGFLLIMNGATIVHPVQFLLDYPLAYACIGLAGLVEWKTPLKAITATTISNIIKLHFHVIAGAVFFSDGNENFKEALASSYAYNCGHLVPETIICAAILGFIALKHRKLCSRQKPD